MMRDGRAMRGIVRRWICVALCGGATEQRGEALSEMRRHRDDVGGKGFAWLGRAARWRRGEGRCRGSALICSGRRRKGRA